MENKRRKFTALGLWWHCLIRFHKSYSITHPIQRRGCLDCEGLAHPISVQTEPKDIDEMLQWANIAIIEMGLDDKERADGGLYAHFYGDEEGPTHIAIRSDKTAWTFDEWAAAALYLDLIVELAKEGCTSAQALDQNKFDAELRRVKGGE